MDPKQTSPLGAPQVGGQEGQPVQLTPAVGDVSGANSQAEAPASPAPVFSTGTTQPAKMAGDLGAESLSTGANVSRTMDSLNDTNQSATGAPIFAKHKFDKIEYATGDILLNKDDPKPKRRFFGGSSTPRPKSAAEISREARREARRLRKLNKSAGAGSVIESAPATTPAPAEKPANPNSSKTTKILVGAVIGILVIVAGVLGVVALTGGNKKPSNKPSTQAAPSEEDAKEAFSKYLSYLFYGEDTKKISPASVNNLGAYKIMNIGSDTSKEKEYIANAIALYEDFSDIFSSTNFINYDLLSNYVSSQKNILMFYNEVINSEGNYSISEYLPIENKYDIFMEHGGIGSQYANMMSERDGMIAAAIADNTTFNCIAVVNGRLDISNECYNSIVTSNADATNAIMSVEEEIIEQVKSAKNSIPLDASEIYAELSNPSPNIDVAVMQNKQYSRGTYA